MVDVRFLPQEWEAEADLSKLSEHPENANEGDDATVDESIGLSGFYGAMLVQRSTGYVLAGNTRLRRLRARGSATGPVLWLDVGADEARRILLADNGTRRNAKEREDKVAALLKKVSRPSMGTGYTQDAVRELLRKTRTPSSIFQPSATTAEDDDESAGDDAEPLPTDDDPAGAPTVESSATGDDEPDEGLPQEFDRFALPIVLNKTEKRLWDDYKKRVGESKDKPAFLVLLVAAMRADVG